MITENQKDLDNFNMILELEMTPNHKMFSGLNMKMANPIDPLHQIAIFVSRMVIMPTNALQKTKGKQQ